MMDATAGGLIKSWCENKGVSVHTATRVERVEAAQAAGATAPAPSNAGSSGGGLKKLFGALMGGKKDQSPAATSSQDSAHRFKVTLSNGQVLDADVVISAAGVKPNTRLLDDSGVEIDNGILVNHFMQTNIPEIYAAGDVARGRDFSTGEFEVHAIQPTASEHGRTAAQNMAGIETHYEGSFNMNVLDTIGLISTSFGLWMGVENGDSAELVDTENFRYLNLQFQGDVLVGATSLGMTQHVGVLRGLIQGKVKLGDWKARLMNDPSRVMDAYLAMNYTAQRAA
jgi:NAD(P)H-nitrite reductase large subunit